MSDGDDKTQLWLQHRAHVRFDKAGLDRILKLFIQKTAPGAEKISLKDIEVDWNEGTGSVLVSYPTTESKPIVL